MSDSLFWLVATGVLLWAWFVLPHNGCVPSSRSLNFDTSLQNHLLSPMEKDEMRLLHFIYLL